MEHILLKRHIGDDGVLKLNLPTRFRNHRVEVLVIMQPLEEEEVDEMGWPIGFFEETYGSLADDPLERPAPLPPDVRDEIE